VLWLFSRTGRRVCAFLIVVATVIVAAPSAWSAWERRYLPWERMGAWDYFYGVLVVGAVVAAGGLLALWVVRGSSGPVDKHPPVTGDPYEPRR
jgi:hypothetical protein